jgi:hypothetical protein
MSPYTPSPLDDLFKAPYVSYNDDLITTHDSSTTHDDPLATYKVDLWEYESKNYKEREEEKR